MALGGNDAAFVAAALAQAEATLLAAGITARGERANVDFDYARFIQLSYEAHLDYVLGYDHETKKGTALKHPG